MDADLERLKSAYDEFDGALDEVVSKNRLQGVTRTYLIDGLDARGVQFLSEIVEIRAKQTKPKQE